MMDLLVDDQRSCGTKVIARTYDGAQAVLAGVKFDKVLLDHDLGERKTGYDLVKWMTAEGITPPWIIIVSSNPPGRDAMAAWLESHGYEQTKPRHFHV